MLIRCIQAEWMKMRHSYLWPILIALPVFSTLLGCANYYMNRAALTNGWYSLWTQVSLFYGEFFLPVLIAICCAYVCRLEHLNKNWNMVMTAPVSAASIFIAKLTIVGTLILLLQILFTVLYLAAGYVLSMPLTVPEETVGWVFRGWIAAITISSIQLALSLRIKSFALPIGISVCAVFIGIGLYVGNIGMIFPYSLLTIGMGVLSQEKLTSIQTIQFFVMNLIFLVLVSALSIRRLKRSDVKA